MKYVFWNVYSQENILYKVEENIKQYELKYTHEFKGKFMLNFNKDEKNGIFLMQIFWNICILKYLIA